MTSRTSRPKMVEGPELGETTFDEWFEAPIFEIDDDERLEQLATSKRAPLRLVGSTAVHLRGRRLVRPEEERQEELSGDKVGIEPHLVVDLRDSLRRRLDGLLDRWAEAEAAGQAKLEDLMLPKRWRG